MTEMIGLLGGLPPEKLRAALSYDGLVASGEANGPRIAPALSPAAAKVRAQQVVRLADFREATVYTAICPDCHRTVVVHGMATTRPPLCDCNTRMVRWA